MDGTGWSWVEVDGAGWSWVQDLVIPIYILSLILVVVFRLLDNLD